MANTRKNLGLVALGLLIGGIVIYAVAAQVRQHATLPDPVVELRSNLVSLPLQLAGGRPTVDLRINGLGPYTFILDTGAEGTILSSSLAEELNLPVLGNANAGAPGGGTVPGKVVRIAKLELGDLTLTDAMAVALDLSSMAKVFAGAGAPRGVLSTKNWRGMLISLNYPAAQIEIKRGELPSADNLKVFSFPGDDRIPSIAVRFAGTSVTLNLDTGAAHGFILPSSFSAKLPLATQPVAVDPLRTLDGITAMTRARLQGNVSIGCFQVEKADVNFAEGIPIGSFGYDVLRQFKVTLDWKNHRVQFDQPGEPKACRS